MIPQNRKAKHRGPEGKSTEFTEGRRGGLWLFAGPAGVAAGFAKIVFHIAELLLQVRDFFLLGSNFGSFVVDVLAGVLLGERFLRIVVVLKLLLVFFALQDIEFFFGTSDFVTLSGETLAP